MPSKQKKLMIIDGNALLHRAWHALPPMSTQKGLMINAAYGFLNIVFKAIKDLKPDYLAVTFDRREKTFRHEEYAEYKAGREKQPDEFYNQLPIVKEVLTALNIKIYELAGYEADDVIGTICTLKTVDRPDILTIIVTGDMDTLQLVDDNTEVYTLRKGINDTVIYNIEAVKEKYSGLTPSQMIDYKGLRGDPSDNIPGVRGVGEKTAIGLLQEFGSIENMYAKMEAKTYPSIKITERLYNVLLENKESAFQSKHLATIVTDAPVKFDLNEALLLPYDKESVFELFQKYEFKTLLNRLPVFGAEAPIELKDGEVKTPRATQTAHQYHHVQTAKEFETFFSELIKQTEFCFDTETDSLDVFKAKLLGISFCWQSGTAYYVDAKQEFLNQLKAIFADAKVRKIGHNLKFDVEVMIQNDVPVNNLYFDTMVASYLLNPGTRTHKLDDLVFRELGYQMTAITELIGKGKGQITMDLVSTSKVADYSCEDADYTWRLVEILTKDLKKNELWTLFTDMEMPLVEVLLRMELNGIKIDVDYLADLETKVQKRIDKLTKQIHELAGEDFNISSPLQLKKILFEKLELSTEGLSKTKTGISTAADELEKLRDLHPIIALIEDYRELTKLQSTYIEALPKLVSEKTGRVHTDFNQTVTATGRLSSSNPNLQNIPIRSDLGREIRRAFIAEPGFKLISADYSQIELRVVACLAKDENMMEIFKRGEDIHSATAGKIFQVPLSEVTKDMRSAAKEVNFGVLYGMGAWGLASRKKISRQQAKEFIDKYFETFSAVKIYLDNLKDLAREKEYAETLFGRRRYLPEINAGVQQVKNSAERMAINMPIQGTAADLLKIAMIAIDKELKKIEAKNPDKKIRMMLQVHDELVFEVPEELVDSVAKLIDEKMEKIHQLAVPLKVDTEVGDNWQDLEKVY